MKLKLLCFFNCLIVFGTIAQNNASPRVRNLLSKADHYRTHFLFTKAIDNYKKALIYKKDCYDAMINMADCYFKTRDYTQALVWYDSVSKHNELFAPHGLQYVNALLSLGESEKAKRWLQQHLQMQPDDKQAREKLTGIETSAVFFKDSSLYTISNLPFNSGNSEFSPTFYGDGIILVANPGTNKYLDLVYYELKKHDSTSTATRSLGKPINSDLHEGPATLYDQDTKMIFTRNHKTKKGPHGTVNVVHFQLFYTEKDKSGQWSEPQLLSINDKEYSTGHPSIMDDGKILYFSSNIPGGFGGSDLYKSRWEGNAWGKPENLGSHINTSGNEMFPYIFNDSILYFSSDGYKGLGGLDIYKVNINSTNEIFNIGYPINSRNDDFSIIIYPDGRKGFFTSNRDSGQGNDDIYEFTLKAEEPNALAPAEKIEDPPTTVFYTVQILALRNPKLVNKKFMKELRGVVRYKGNDGLNRYTYGEYQGAEDAVAMLNTIRAMGYKDAFIRRVEKYVEFSDTPGENTDLLYEKMARSNK